MPPYEGTGRFSAVGSPHRSAFRGKQISHQSADWFEMTEQGTFSCHPEPGGPGRLLLPQKPRHSEPVCAHRRGNPCFCGNSPSAHTGDGSSSFLTGLRAGLQRRGAGSGVSCGPSQALRASSPRRGASQALNREMTQVMNAGPGLAPPGVLFYNSLLTNPQARCIVVSTLILQTR